MKKKNSNLITDSMVKSISFIKQTSGEYGDKVNRFVDRITGDVDSLQCLISVCEVYRTTYDVLRKNPKYKEKKG